MSEIIMIESFSFSSSFNLEPFESKVLLDVLFIDISSPVGNGWTQW